MVERLVLRRFRATRTWAPNFGFELVAAHVKEKAHARQPAAEPALQLLVVVHPCPGLHHHAGGLISFEDPFSTVSTFE